MEIAGTTENKITFKAPGGGESPKPKVSPRNRRKTLKPKAKKKVSFKALGEGGLAEYAVHTEDLDDGMKLQEIEDELARIEGILAEKIKAKTKLEKLKIRKDLEARKLELEEIRKRFWRVQQYRHYDNSNEQPNNKELTDLHIQLITAINKNNYELVNELIQMPEVNLLRRYAPKKQEILHIAVVRASIEIIILLLDNGAQVNSRDIAGLTPLHHAVARIDVVTLLLDRGAEVDAVSDRDFTPLHYAVSNGVSIEIITLLLTRGAQVDASNEEGFTSLHYEVMNGANIDVLTLLLTRGAQVNMADASGLTALHYATETNSNVMRLLLTRGANVNAQTLRGDSPLHYVVFNEAAAAIITVFLEQFSRHSDNSPDYSLFKKAVTAILKLSSKIKINIYSVNESILTRDVRSISITLNTISSLLDAEGQINNMSELAVALFNFENNNQAMMTLLLGSGANTDLLDSFDSSFSENMVAIFEQQLNLSDNFRLIIMASRGGFDIQVLIDANFFSALEYQLCYLNIGHLEDLREFASDYVRDHEDLIDGIDQYSSIEQYIAVLIEAQGFAVDGLIVQVIADHLDVQINLYSITADLEYFPGNSNVVNLLISDQQYYPIISFNDNFRPPVRESTEEEVDDYFEEFNSSVEEIPSNITAAVNVTAAVALDGLVVDASLANNGLFGCFAPNEASI